VIKFFFPPLWFAVVFVCFAQDLARGATTKMCSVRYEISQGRVFVDNTIFDNQSEEITILRHRLNGDGYAHLPGKNINDLRSQGAKLISYMRALAGKPVLLLRSDGWHPTSGVTHERLLHRVVTTLARFEPLDRLTGRYTAQVENYLKNGKLAEAASADAEFSQVLKRQPTQLEISGYTLYPFVEKDPKSTVLISWDDDSIINGIKQYDEGGLTYLYVLQTEGFTMPDEETLKQELAAADKERIREAWKAAEMVEFKTNREMFGFSLQEVNQDIVVDKIVINSDASLKGVRKSWKLLEINASNVIVLGYPKLCALLAGLKGANTFLFLDAEGKQHKITLTKAIVP